MSRPLLEIRGLTVAYGPIVAVQGIDLRVDEGDVVALIGANGAGKTTTLRTIAGLLRPRAGTIVFDGERVAGRRPHRLVRRGLVLVPEGRGILGRLTVEENLLLAASGRRDGGHEEALARVYDRFPVLGERRGQRGGTLSGGEQQMLAIARALVTGARLLMLDEPSLGLAPIVSREVLGGIAELKREGATILLVEQNARAALEIADRSYLMETGRIVREGSAGEFLSDDDVMRAYLGAGRRGRGR